MSAQNTLYIAVPLFSEKLQRFDGEASFPPIKKIGITTDHPERRERELLGTVSPIKISIVKAWTGINARAVELMLHTILDNLRIDGEYFWDGNETLVDAVSNFIRVYHLEAQEFEIDNDQDVKAASEAANIKSSQRIYTEVVPYLDDLNIEYTVTKSERAVRFARGDYRLSLSTKTGGRYTLTIFSKTKSTDDAIKDFPGAQELSMNVSDDSNRKARIPMAKLESVIDAIKAYTQNSGA
jgi:hypothetical protein